MPETEVKVDNIEVPAAVEKAKGSSKLDPTEVSEAMDWLLDPNPVAISTRTFEVNVSSDDEPKWVRIKVQAIPRERIQAIRDMATKRGGKNGEDTPENTAFVNLKIATEGMLEPDLKDPRVLKQFGADPSDALKAKFAHKPGLIDRISGEVLSAAGYDDDDLRTVGKTS